MGRHVSSRFLESVVVAERLLRETIFPRVDLCPEGAPTSEVGTASSEFRRRCYDRCWAAIAELWKRR